MTVVFNKLTGGYDVTKMIGGHKYRIIKQGKGSPVTLYKDGIKMKNLTMRFTELIRAGQKALNDYEGTSVDSGVVKY